MGGVGKMGWGEVWEDGVGNMMEMVSGGNLRRNWWCVIMEVYGWGEWWRGRFVIYFMMISKKNVM